MIVNEYAFEMLSRERDAQLTIELERRRVQLERAEETAGPAPSGRSHWFLLGDHGGRTRPAEERHAH